LHELLKVVTAAGLVDGIDALRVVDVVHQVPQLGGRIPRQPSETRLLPKTRQEIEVVGMLACAVVVGASWPHGVPRHDMDGGGSGGARRFRKGSAQSGVFDAAMALGVVDRSKRKREEEG
jgi:hypothetical protein